MKRFILAAIVAASGCVVVPDFGSNRANACPSAQVKAINNWGQVTNGMTPTQVASKLGRPIFTVTTPKKDVIWTYNMRACSGGAVVFRGGKVISKALRNG